MLLLMVSLLRPWLVLLSAEDADEAAWLESMLYIGYGIAREFMYIY